MCYDMHDVFIERQGLCMILADVYDLLNNLFVQVLKFVFIAALIVLAVFLGAKLRKYVDKKKSAKEADKDTDSNTTTE